tara:strand:+ start:3063 stop:3983 length:921 start_codon:yes stop_codon:yes gene_type:complete
MKSLTEKIKNKALELGFDLVGVADVDLIENEKNHLHNWLGMGYHASMDWMEKRKEERGNIQKYYPEAKSVISLGLNYYTNKKQSDLRSKYKFSNYAWGEDYHIVLKERLYILLKWIMDNFSHIKGIACVDTSPVMEKVWAQRAGLGWQGKHTNLINQELGSWFFLGELILNHKLDYDPPFQEDLCGSCTACIDACPTQAITPYKLDSGSCISYLTIEHRGDLPNNQNELHGWIYGCDICQEVCPWNEKFSTVSSLKEFYPRKEIIEKSDLGWEKISETEFKKIFKRSAAKRTKYNGLKRNIEANSL